MKTAKTGWRQPKKPAPAVTHLYGRLGKEADGMVMLKKIGVEQVDVD